MTDAERDAAATKLDERLKAVLEPQPAAVERVVRGALAGQRRPAAPRRRRRRLLGLAAGAALATAALLVALRQLPPFPPPSAPAPRSAIEIRNGGGMVTARSPSGRLWVVRAGPPHAAAGSIILVHKGGNR